VPVAHSSPRDEDGSARTIDEVFGAIEIVAGVALLILAAILFVVGLFETTWAGRADIWALALFAAATGAPVAADGYRRLRGGRLVKALMAGYHRVRSTMVPLDEPSQGADPGVWRSDPVVRRLVAARTWLITACVLLLTLIGDVRMGPAPDGESREERLRATGDLVLLREPEQLTVVVPLTGGGIASCSPQDERWSGEWSLLRIDRDWGELGRSSGLFSVYRTIQLLGQVGGGLVQGRYEDNRWHGPYPVTLGNQNQLIVDARGRPAFFQHIAPDGEPYYFTLAPDFEGGVRLYWRWRHRDWMGRTDLIGGTLGEVEAVAAIEVPDEGIKAVVRVDDQLFQLARPPDTTPGPIQEDQLEQGWTETGPILATSGPFVRVLRVLGDPALVRTTVLGSGDQPEYALVVETTAGLSLATAADFHADRWAVERLPVTGPVSSVALADAMIDGRPSLVVAYRAGETVYGMYRSGGVWRRPEPIRCTEGE
jgi:hypothetical protein